MSSLRAGLLATLVLTLSGLAETARAETTYTTDYVYNARRQVVLEVAPDTSGTGARSATHYVYDADGQLVRVEKGTATSASEAAFTALEVTATDYDPAGNKTKVTVWNGATAPSSSTPLAVTQTSYDALNKPVCVAVRMNPALFVSGLPGDPCALGTAGSNGADRIAKTTYNLAGDVLTVVQGLGTSNQRTYATYTYDVPAIGSQSARAVADSNGQQQTVTDANGNKTTYVYDGLDRLSVTYFPSTTLAAGGSNTADYEQYGYDAAGNRTSLRKRDARTINTCFDALNRESRKYLPTSGGPALTNCMLTAGNAADVFTDYDGVGHKTYARLAGASGYGVVYGYDTAGRLTSETTSGSGYASRAMSYAYDAASNRTRVTWPDGFYADYVYNPKSQLTAIRENGATSGVGVLASFAYDPLGRRTDIVRGNGANTSFGYDTADRLTSTAHAMGGGIGSQTWSYAYSPASQLLTKAASNNAYAFTPAVENTAKAYDGLNRDATIVAVSGYDANQNVTYDGTRTFTYDVENRLITESGPVIMTVGYDPLGRLQQTAITVSSVTTTTQFLYDGSRLSAEYDPASGNLLRRYVHGSGVDEPLVWYEGAATSTDRRWLHVDRQGSVVAQTDNSGLITALYSYGPWGEPNDSWSVSGSRFRYTGQIAIPQAELYHYKARVYDPMQGRFLQTDPIGYKDDLNLYAYVGGDPMNKADPTGNESVTYAGYSGYVARGGEETYDKWKADNEEACRKAPAVCLGTMAVATGGPWALGMALESSPAQAIFKFITDRTVLNPKTGLTVYQTQRMASFLGRGEAGARNLLQAASKPGFKLPRGVTVQSLERYREVAVRAIGSGKPGHVQELRIKAIDAVLKAVKKADGF